MNSKPGSSLPGASVSLRRLGKRYGHVTAVEDVTLEVGAGEFLTLLGPSGSGKTTVLMMVAGFVTPDQGSVEIGGRDVYGLAPNRRGLGMVFQNYLLFPHMTVGGNVAFPLEVRGIDRATIRSRVANVLDLVRLAGLESRNPRQLSGGQQQRVALARALVYEPRVLLMDEPLGALDKKLREQMQLELKRIQERLGITVIYVTHDQSEALTMSDRIAIMRDGQVEQVGTPDELYEFPVNRFVADFLGDSNFVAGEWQPPSGATVLELRADAGPVLRVAAGEGPGPCPGTRGLVAIRPEKLRLEAAAATVRSDADEQAALGTVTEVIYSGTVTRYSVEVDGLGVWVVVDQNRRSRPRFRSDDRVWTVWSVGDTRMLRP